MALPPGWAAAWHSAAQRYFYIYREEGETTFTSTWDDPRRAQAPMPTAGAEAPATPAADAAARTQQQAVEGGWNVAFW
eukprot:1612300-Alexandrium_andersonii.AAC.1